MRSFAAFLAVTLALALPAGLAQQKQKDKKDQKQEEQKPAAQQPQQKKDEPAPLFGGKLGLKSSRQEKDTATLGFNGLDEKGMVAKQFLEANPTVADEVKVQLLANTTVEREELIKFIQDGGLKQDVQKIEPSKAQ
jgi:hypothetical protein